MAAAWGDGPVDAAYDAIRRAIGSAPEVESYSIGAVTEGKEALGEATVRIRDGERTCVGRGLSTDVIEASAKAYINAINRMASLAGRQTRRTDQGRFIDMPSTITEKLLAHAARKPAVERAN